MLGNACRGDARALTRVNQLCLSPRRPPGICLRANAKNSQGYLSEELAVAIGAGWQQQRPDDTNGNWKAGAPPALAWLREKLLQGLSGVGSQLVKKGYTLNTKNRAVRSASLGNLGLPFNIIPRVLGKRDGRPAALRQAVMNQAIFADVKVAASGGAMPVVWLGA